MEFLLFLQLDPNPNYRKPKSKNIQIWEAITSHLGCSKLIPYIFDVIEQQSSSSLLNIELNILIAIFKFLIKCDEKKKFYTDSPKKYYNRLINKFDLSKIRYDGSLYKLIAKKIKRMEMKQVVNHYNPSFRE